MDTETYLAAVAREGEALAVAARRDLDAAVPSCPGWTVSDLLAHMGRVFRSMTVHVERRAREMVPASEIPAAPAGPEVLAFYEEGLAALLPALAAIGPEEPVWTWSGHDVGGFYHRRAAHETAVHRWDTEAAVGEPAPIDGDLAADGITEFYERVLPFAARRWQRELPAGSLHLHRTDGPGEWTVRFAEGELRLGREHGKADAAVRGGGSDLLLLVWHRRGLDGLEVFGDEATAAAWASLAP